MIVTGPQSRGALLGLAAAALFGISPPLAKLLLPEAGPLLLAGLLYLGAGLGLVGFELIRGPGLRNREAHIRRADVWLLAGIVVTGGILGPVCMLFGLQRLSGVLGSLLLNLEAPFTILLAVAIFREHLGGREVIGAIAIFFAAATLSYHPGVAGAEILGVVAMVAACLSWAIDNNLTQRLSLRDPVAVTRIKTLGAGACTLTLALMAGESLPRPAIIGSVLALGLVSYGVSLVLDTQALRLIGAAREATLFATAPFIGAVVAVPVLGERWGLRELVAAGIMAIGVITLLREHHSHEHSHSEIEHDHTHVHGEHHNHPDDKAQPGVGAHAHLHRHVALVHDHPHVSEIHHRHEHD